MLTADTCNKKSCDKRSAMLHFEPLLCSLFSCFLPHPSFTFFQTSVMWLLRRATTQAVSQRLPSAVAHYTASHLKLLCYLLFSTLFIIGVYWNLSEIETISVVMCRDYEEIFLCWVALQKLCLGAQHSRFSLISCSFEGGNRTNLRNVIVRKSEDGIK